MPKLLVLFHSRTGATAALADAIAEGARTIRFTEVDIRRVRELAGGSADGNVHADMQDRLRRYRELDDVERLAEYDAIAIGTPVRNGSMAAEVRRLLDHASALASHNALTDRVAGVFCSGSVEGHAGERALWSVLTSLAAMGMLIVPPDRSAGDVHAPAAAAFALAVTAAGEPDDAQRARAHRHGARLARVAEWVRHAKGHEAAAGGPHGHHHPHHHHHHG